MIDYKAAALAYKKAYTLMIGAFDADWEHSGESWRFFHEAVCTADNIPLDVERALNDGEHTDPQPTPKAQQSTAFKVGDRVTHVLGKYNGTIVDTWQELVVSVDGHSELCHWIAENVRYLTDLPQPNPATPDVADTNSPPFALRVGDRVRGTYFDKPYTGHVTQIRRMEGWIPSRWEIRIMADEPVTLLNTREIYQEVTNEGKPFWGNTVEREYTTRPPVGAVVQRGAGGMWDYTGIVKNHHDADPIAFWVEWHKFDDAIEPGGNESLSGWEWGMDWCRIVTSPIPGQWWPPATPAQSDDIPF